MIMMSYNGNDSNMVTRNGAIDMQIHPDHVIVARTRIPATTWESAQCFPAVSASVSVIVFTLFVALQLATIGLKSDSILPTPVSRIFSRVSKCMKFHIISHVRTNGRIHAPASSMSGR
jgi:hypothetical protein